MEVFKPGTQVKLGSIHGVVNQVSITGKSLHVEYEVVWWNEGQRVIQWLHDHEVQWDEVSETIEIGFHACITDPPSSDFHSAENRTKVESKKKKKSK